MPPAEALRLRDARPPSTRSEPSSPPAGAPSVRATAAVSESAGHPGWQTAP
jgi:hypothetical protein